MMRMPGRAAALALLLAAGPVRAHFFPGERQVIVQAERDAVAILVTLRPPSGLFADVLELDAHFTLGGDKLVKAVLAARALGVLEIELDGKPFAPADMQVKLVEDPPKTGKKLVAILMSGTIPAGKHRLEINVATPVEPTATSWLDRSQGRIAAYGPRPAGVPFQDRGQLVLEWR